MSNQEVISLLERAREHMRERGKCEGNRMGYDGGVCAIGALDFDLGYITPTPEGPELPFTYRSATDPRYFAALRAMSSQVEDADLDKADTWNHFEPGMNLIGMYDARVAWYSNTHTTQEVLNLFDRAIFHLELEDATVPSLEGDLVLVG